MGDNFKRVQTGQKLAIPARAYNAMLETAEAYQRNKNSGGDGSGQGGYSSSVYIKNSSGSDAARFDVLGISDIVFSPADSDALPQFKNKVVLTGVIPISTDHAGGRFVICEEPIANGSIGRAFAHGVCQVQINIIDDAHKFADVKDGDHTLLESAASGAVSILWKETGIGTKWAIVRFGSAGGGGTVEASSIWVKVKKGLTYPDRTADPDTEPDLYYGQSKYYVRRLDDSAVDYVSDYIYALNETCIGSDDKKYTSSEANNIGNDPITTTGHWTVVEDIVIEFAEGYETPVRDLRNCLPWVEVDAIKEIKSRIVDGVVRYYFCNGFFYTGDGEESSLRQGGEDNAFVRGVWE